ncbi:MAG: TOMM precursor leader peptide-binding protein [Bacteroidota bacterium]
MEQYTPAYRFWYTSKGKDAEKTRYMPLLSTIKLGNVKPSNLSTLMKRYGYMFTTKKEAGLWLITVDTLTDPRLAKITEHARSLDKHVAVYKATGTSVAHIFFSPRSTCWSCFERRRRVLDGPATFLYRHLPDVPPITEPAMFTESSLQLADAWFAYAVECFFRTSDENQLASKVNTLDLATMQLSSDIIPRSAHCPVCAPPQSRTVDTLEEPTLNTHKRMTS